MPLPNFFIVGAIKGGTTSLHHYLSQHPEVFMPVRKEFHYYSFGIQGKEFIGPNAVNDNLITTHDQYLPHFADGEGYKAIGDASPTYLYYPNAAEEIAKDVPDARIIMSLRQPAERAFSHYLHMRREAREQYDNFADALAVEEQRIRDNWAFGFHYYNVGLYAEQVQRYIGVFGSERVLVFLYDDLKADTPAVIRKIYAHIGVDPDFTPDLERRYNVGGKPKNESMHNIYLALRDVRKYFRNLLPRGVRRQIWQSVIKYMRNQNMERVTLEPELQEELNNKYRDNILRLSQIIDRDLTHWLTPSSDEAHPSP